MKWKYFLDEDNNIIGYSSWNDRTSQCPDDSYVNIDPNELTPLKDEYGNCRYKMIDGKAELIDTSPTTEQEADKEKKDKKIKIQENLVEIIEEIAKVIPKIDDIIGDKK